MELAQDKYATVIAAIKGIKFFQRPIRVFAGMFLESIPGYKLVHYTYKNFNYPIFAKMLLLKSWILTIITYIQPSWIKRLKYKLHLYTLHILTSLFTYWQSEYIITRTVWAWLCIIAPIHCCTPQCLVTAGVLSWGRLARTMGRVNWLPWLHCHC